MISWYIDSSCISTTSHRSEELLGRADSLREGVDVVVAGVHVERGPGGGRDAVAAHDRPGAVVPDAHGDAVVVEDLTHVVRARRLGAPDPLGPEEPPGHTTVRNANLMHPLPMTPSLMGRGVYYPEQIELFTDTLRRVLVEGEKPTGVESLRIQRGKLFHTTKMARSEERRVGKEC